MASMDLVCEDVDLGFLVHPSSGGPHPAVVMIHDVWGLTPHTRDMARRLAVEGFAVLAIDLYRELDVEEIRDPAEWMQTMSDPRALDDIASAVGCLRAHPAVDGREVAVLGFCMGGMYALLAGCSDCGAAAVVPFYGILSHQHGLLAREGGLDPTLKPREPLFAARTLRVPMLAFFGEEDPYIPLADVDALESNLSGMSLPVHVVRVPGVGHAFMNDTRPDAHHPEKAREAWNRTVSFLRRCLGGPGIEGVERPA